MCQKLYNRIFNHQQNGKSLAEYVIGIHEPNFYYRYYLFASSLQKESALALDRVRYGRYKCLGLFSHGHRFEDRKIRKDLY